MNQAQVNLLEDQSSRQKRKQFFILFLIILFTVIICAIISVFTVLKHHIESQSPSANPREAIQAACQATEYYYHCIKSLSPRHNHRHKIHESDVFRLSIRTAFAEFLIIYELPQELASKVNSKNIRGVLIDCQNLFNDSLNLLDRSLIMITKNYVGLDDQEILDLRNLMVQAMKNVDRCTKNVDRCLDGLNGTRATQREIVKIKNAKGRIEEAEKYMLNSLSILENKDSIRDIFYPSFQSILASFMLSRENFVLSIALFCSQYLLLVFLFCSLLRVFK